MTMFDVKKYRKEYYEKNKEKIKAKVTEWAENNQVKRREYQKQYRILNAESIKKTTKKYRLKNESIIQKKRKEYYQNNKSAILTKKKIYREKVRQLGRNLTNNILDEETRLKISRKNKGMFEQVDHPMKGKKGQLNPLYGRKLSEEHIEKNRKSHLGKKQSEETKKKRSKSLMGKNTGKSHIAPNKGKGMSEEQKIKLRNAWNYEKHFTEATRYNLRLARKNIILPKKDSKPERMMQLALTLQGIKFEKHKLFETKTLWHRPDIFIEPNIIVEVDGVRFHVNNIQIRRDLYESQEFNLMGYHVIRIRDKDIIKDANECALNIINLIKQLQFRVKLT